MGFSGVYFGSALIDAEIVVFGYFEAAELFWRGDPQYQPARGEEIHQLPSFCFTLYRVAFPHRLVG